MTETIQCTVDERGVARVSLNRPALHNAFDEELIATLTGAIQALGDNGQVRMIVISGNGKSFCAGADLNWMRRAAEQSEQANLEDALRLSRLMQTLDTVPKPTIARVHGATYGGGVGLVACCDIALAGDSARFCLSEVKLGLVPAVIAPFVVRAMGGRAARRLFMTAETFSAAEARRHGLVHELARDADLDAQLDETVGQLLLGGRLALARCKRLIREVAETNLDSALHERMAREIAEARASEEGREGLDAFLNKRRPGWADDVQ